VSPTRRLIVILGAIWIGLVVVGTVVIALLTFPPGDAADVSKSISDTVRLITFLAWPVFSLVIIALIGAMMISRRAPDARAASAAELRGNPRAAMTWTVVVSAIVLALAIFGTVTLSNEQTAESLGLGGRAATGSATGGQAGEGSNLEVQVIAQQWAFTYRYPSFGGFESAQLVLPVGANVTIHVTSLDVTHSFWYPAIGVKADAVPEHDNIFNTTPQTIGTYRIVCGELCGLWHGSMDDNNARVVSSSDFQAWAQQQQQLDAPIMQYLPPYAYVYVPSPGAYGS
jgi:cytochrome c oxidase subunit II